MQPAKRIPASIVIAVALAVFGTAAFSLSAALSLDRGSFDEAERSFASFIRWQMFTHGTAVASSLLMASGLFFIASRLSRWQRTLIQISAWIHLGWIVWALGRPVLFELVKDPDNLELLAVWVWRVIMVVMSAAIVLVTIAARAWWRPRSPLVPIAAVVLVVLEAMAWAPWIASSIQELRKEHGLLYQAIWPIREVLTSGAFLIIVHALMQETTQPLPQPNAASSWFRGAEATLLVRIIAAVLLALIAMAKVPSAGKIVFVIGPLINVAALTLFAWCMFSIERASLAGMPRIRLLLGGVIAAWGAGVTILQAVATYGMLDRDSFGGFDAETATMWSIGGPLIGITGMVLVCSAIASFGAARGNQALREMAMARAVIHAVLMGAVMLMPLALAKTSSAGGAMMLGLMIAAAAIAAQAVLLGVMRRAGDSIEPVPTIPEARLR